MAEVHRKCWTAELHHDVMEGDRAVKRRPADGSSESRSGCSGLPCTLFEGFPLSAGWRQCTPGRLTGTGCRRLVRRSWGFGRAGTETCQRQKEKKKKKLFIVQHPRSDPPTTVAWTLLLLLGFVQWFGIGLVFGRFDMLHDAIQLIGLGPLSNEKNTAEPRLKSCKIKV